MEFVIKDGYYLIYAKKGGMPKNKHFNSRMDFLNFFIENIENIDFMSLNDVIIDKDKLINDNKILSRYLKIIRIYEI